MLLSSSWLKTSPSRICRGLNRRDNNLSLLTDRHFFIQHPNFLWVMENGENPGSNPGESIDCRDFQITLNRRVKVPADFVCVDRREHKSKLEFVRDAPKRWQESLKISIEEHPIFYK